MKEWNWIIEIVDGVSWPIWHRGRCGRTLELLRHDLPPTMPPDETPSKVCAECAEGQALPAGVVLVTLPPIDGRARARAIIRGRIVEGDSEVAGVLFPDELRPSDMRLELLVQPQARTRVGA